MADYELSVGLDASQAIQASDKLSTALKKVDTATLALSKSLNYSNKSVYRKLASEIGSVQAATNLLASSFSQFSSLSKRTATEVTGSYARADRSMKQVIASFTRWTNQISDAEDSYTSASKSLDKYSNLLTSLGEKAKISAADLKKLAKAKKEVDAAMEAANAAKYGIATTSKSFQSPYTTLRNQARSSDNFSSTLAAQYQEIEARTNSLREATARLGDELFNARMRYESFAKGTANQKQYATKLSAMEREYTALNKALDLSAAEQDRLQKELQDTKIKTTILNEAVRTTETRYDTARISAKAYENQLASLNKRQDLLSKNSASLISNQVSQRTSNALKANSSVPVTNMASSFKDVESLLGSVAKSARSTVYAFNALRLAINLAFFSSGLNAATRVVSNFDQTMADLTSIVAKGNSETIQAAMNSKEFRFEIAALKDTMVELGATSRYTTNEAGQGMIYMAQAGLQYKEVISAASSVLDLAVASNTSLAKASDIVIQSLRTFNIDATEAWKVTDTLAVGAKESVTSIEQLADALHYVGPIAHTMGIRIDTVVAALGTLSDSGLQASMAGTGLRRVISEIVNPTAKAKNILESAGLTADKLNIQALGLMQVLENIKDANLSVGQSFAVWGDRGTPALQTLITNFDELKKKMESINLDADNFKGSAHAMREVREDTIQGQFLASVSAIQEFLIKFAEYTNAIEGSKSILSSFASGLREINTDVGSSISTFVKWAAMLTTTFISLRSINKVAPAISSVKTRLSEFSKEAERLPAVYERALAIKKVNAEFNKTSIAAIAAGDAILAFASKSKAASMAVLLFTNAIKGMWNIFLSLAIGTAIGFLVKWVTETDRADDATERLKTTVDMFFKDVYTNGASATETMKQFADSLNAVSTASIEIKKRGFEADLDAIADQLGRYNIFGGHQFFSELFGGNDKYDIGNLLFGVDTKTLLANAQKDSSQLEGFLNSFADNWVDQKKLSGIVDLNNSDQVNAINNYVEKLKTYLVNLKQVQALESELENRRVDKQGQEAAKSLYDSLPAAAKSAHDQLKALSESLRNADWKDFAKGADNAREKIYGLTAAFSTDEANTLWKALNTDIKNFQTFFDFDPSTLTTSLKTEWQDLIKTLSAAPGSNVLLSALGLDEKTLKNNLSVIQLYTDTLKELREVRFGASLKEMNLDIDLAGQLTSIGDSADIAKQQLMELFSKDELSNFVINFKDGFAEVALASGVLAENVEGLSGRVSAALSVIYDRLKVFQTIKLDRMIANQNVLLSIPKKQRSSVSGFASQAGISVSQYNPQTGSFGDEKLDRAFAQYKELNPVKDSTTRRTKKLFSEIETELKELALKYQQYYAEIKLGSTASVDIQKMEIEKLKESSSILEKADSLGISRSDERIKYLEAEIERVYALREAALKLKAAQEAELAPKELNLAQAQRYGGEGYSAQLDLLQTQLKQLREQAAVFEPGSVGSTNALAEIANKEEEIYQLRQNRIISGYELDEQIANEKADIDAVYQAQLSLNNAKIAELELQKASGKLSEAEIERLNKQIELYKLKEPANPHDMVAGFYDAIKEMNRSTTEYSTMGNIVNGVTDSMTNAIVNFCDTGKFELSEFTREVGLMIVELTTKMMLIRTLGAVFSFANGGPAEITANALGGLQDITHAKKYAKGGMLTSPTLFNTTAGTALAGEAGKEHLMPAGRLSNGKWGVYAEGMGNTNNTFVINNTVNVEGGSTGNTDDDAKLAQLISEKMRDSVAAAVRRELAQQMRSGGMLNSSGNRRW